MDETRRVILKNQNEFPNFKYYLSILDEIEDNVETMPDISIESCKSLFEGLSKTMLNELNIPYKKGGNGDSPNVLLKKVLGELQEASDNLEDDFINSMSNFVHRITEIRNERGDISHGKPSPKEISSDKTLSNVVLGITDSTASYLLKIFFNADWSYLEEIKYEDNEEFNEFLDEQYDLPGVKYSQALLDQDPIYYEQELDEYLSKEK